MQNVVTINADENSLGARRFRNEIGIQYSEKMMAQSTNFIWRIFKQNNPADRKDITKVSLVIDDKMEGVMSLSNQEIHVSATYLGSFQGDVKREFTGVLYYLMTKVWQWNGAGQAPSELIDGIADYVRLRAGYVPGHWVKPGQGDRWDQGHEVTARFLAYCNGLWDGFVAELNKKMRTGYSEAYFVDLLGKSVDQLWKDYKAASSQIGVRP